MVLCLFLSGFSACYSQDNIYMDKEIKQGKVLDISSSKIKYREPGNAGSVNTIPRNKVLFIFNSFGRYVAFSANDTSTVSPGFFQSTNNRYPTDDTIFTSQGNKIDCSIIVEDENTIYYSAGNGVEKMDKANVIGIVYKTGKHKILTSNTVAAANLLLRLQNIDRAAAELKRLNSVDSSDKSMGTTTAMVNSKIEDKPLSAASVHETPVHEIPVHETAVHETSKKSVKNDNFKSTSLENSPEYVDELNEVTFKDYEKKALEKTSELSGYLKVLCDKSTDYDRSNKAIDQACTLFVNEGSVVELSTLNNTSIQRFKIRDYLKRLKLVKYGKVEIQWANIQYVSKLRKSPDGRYRGVITFEQTFTGFVEDKIVYSDKTTKNVEVVLTTYKKSVEGKSKTIWDVLLSDIRVVETKNS